MPSQNTDISSSKKRYDYIDILNILSSFSVVVLHCSGNVFTFEKTPAWFVSLALQCIARFAVPVFFMITGITLLEYRKKYSTKEFYKKRFLKTGVPFLFWSCFYVFLNYGRPLPNFTKWIELILNNGCLNIFWFFYELFALYLMMPIFSLLVEKEHKKAITGLVCFFFFFSSVFPLIRLWMPISSALVPPIVAEYAGFLFCGYFLKHETFSKKQRLGIYAVGAVALFTMFFGTYFLSSRKGELDMLLLDYKSITNLPYSFAVLLFFKHCSFEKLYKWIPRKCIQMVAGTSFGIYLTHMILLILNEWYHPLKALSVIARLFLLPLLVYPICVLFVLLIQKIPVLKKLIP